MGVCFKSHFQFSSWRITGKTLKKSIFFPSFLYLPQCLSNISSPNSFKMFHFHEFSKYNNTKFAANNAKLALCSILSIKCKYKHKILGKYFIFLRGQFTNC